MVVTALLRRSIILAHATLLARRCGDNPLTLGVASGDPRPDGIVLWTRLAPEPANPTSLGSRAIPVGWRIAADSRMRHVVSRGVAIAPAELAHSVHVEARGLRYCVHSRGF